MRTRKLYVRERGKYRAGRQASIKHILVPQEVKEEMDLFKESYSEVMGQKVTYEQILRRWMDHAGRIDPDVKEKVEKKKADQLEVIATVAIAASVPAKGGDEVEEIEMHEKGKMTGMDPSEPEERKIKTRVRVFTHPDGRRIVARRVVVQGAEEWWPVNPDTGYTFSPKKLDDGFILQVQDEE